MSDYIPSFIHYITEIMVKTYIISAFVYYEYNTDHKNLCILLPAYRGICEYLDHKSAVCTKTCTWKLTVVSCESWHIGEHGLYIAKPSILCPCGTRS